MGRKARSTYRHQFDLGEYGFPEIPLFGAYRSPKAFDALGMHEHGAFEICHLVDGRQNYNVDGRDYILKSGDIFVTRPGEPHSSGKQPQERGALYWIHVVPPARGEEFLGMRPAFGKAIAHSLGSIEQRRFAGSPKVGTTLEHLHEQLLSPPGLLTRVQISNAIVSVLLELIRCACKPVAGEDRKSDLNMLIGYINDNIEESLRVPALAARMGLSESWFKARFKKETGLSPAEYVLRLKLAKAREFLESGKGNVTAAAMKFGFASSQHFASAFKKFTHTKPSQISAGRGQAAGRDPVK